MPSLQAWTECKGLPLRLCNGYREKLGLPPLPEDWTIDQPSRGLGDTIAKGIHRLTRGKIKPCGGCKKRQAVLNRVVPFRQKQAKSNGQPPAKRSTGTSGSPFRYTSGTVPQFITTANLMADAKRLASMLPHDTSRIIGVARSGLCVSTMVAMILHRPLDIIRQSKGDLIDGGNGWRLSGNTTAAGPVVVIDDTCMSGNSFRHVMPIVRRRYPNAISAAVYVNPKARTKPDLWVRDLPWPHVLEWNLFNSIMSPGLAVDFDGILCEDCPAGSDDDGRKYLDFLTNVRPLYPMRKTPIPLIVTARCEKYRQQTQEWLAKHGIRATKLIMGPWSGPADRNRHDVAAYKAGHYRDFMRRHRGIKPAMFVESCPHQAKRIAELSGGLVVCPAAERCFA
jgi:hypoxanthine phosphoribosyltransferase